MSSVHVVPNWMHDFCRKWRVPLFAFIIFNLVTCSICRAVQSDKEPMKILDRWCQWELKVPFSPISGVQWLSLANGANGMSRYVTIIFGFFIISSPQMLQFNFATGNRDVLGMSRKTFEWICYCWFVFEFKKEWKLQGIVVTFICSLPVLQSPPPAPLPPGLEKTSGSEENLSTQVFWVIT